MWVAGDVGVDVGVDGRREVFTLLMDQHRTRAGRVYCATASSQAEGKSEKKSEGDESRGRVRARLGWQLLAENREAPGNGILRRQCWWAASWGRGQKAAWADGEERKREREMRLETEADGRCLAWLGQLPWFERVAVVRAA